MMHYFVGIGIPITVTGVDKAMFNRLKLYQRHNTPAKIITTLYNHLEYGWCIDHQIQDDVINMYSYFQKALYTVSHHFDYYKYWCAQPSYDVQVLSNDTDVLINENGRMIMYARFLDASLQKLDFINYFNADVQFVKHEEYDYRGFLSSVSHYNSNKIVYQEFLTPQGEKVIEKYYHDKEQSAVPSAIFVKNHHGIFEQFASEDALVTYFIEQLYKEGDQFIIDRPLEIVPPFINLRGKYPVAVMLHMKHLRENVHTEQLKWPYEKLFDHLKYFDALICSTNAQKEDIERYIQHFKHVHIPVFNIPVGYIEQNPSLNINVKQPYQLISIARYEQGKNLHHQIELVYKLKPHFNEITLDLYGFGNEWDNLQQLIDQYDANDYIRIRGYSNQLKNVYESATLSLITSHSEGFSLAILESLNHNTPVIAYDVPYGPNEIIQDDINGNLIPYGNTSLLFDRVYQLLNDINKRNRFYSACTLSVQQYRSSEIWNRWQLLHEQLRNL